MKGSKPKKPEPKEVVTLRVSPSFLKEIREFVLDYNTAHVKPTFSMGMPEVVTDSLALRWALQAGLPELRRHLAASQKGRAR